MSILLAKASHVAKPEVRGQGSAFPPEGHVRMWLFSVVSGVKTSMQ